MELLELATFSVSDLGKIKAAKPNRVNATILSITNKVLSQAQTKLK